MKRLKRCLSVTLTVLTIINSSGITTTAPIPAAAARKKPAMISGREIPEPVTTDDDLPDSDELLTGYIDKLSGNRQITPYGRLAGDNLSGNDRFLYDLLKEKIAAIASGSLNHTAFDIPLSELNGYQKRWTRADLGGVTLISNGNLTAEAKNALTQKLTCNPMNVKYALMNDFPYELYWFNKTIPHYSDFYLSYSYPRDGSYIELTDNSVIQFHFTVDPTYAAKDENGNPQKYQTDSDRLSSIPIAVKNAHDVVEAAKDKSDYGKLLHYRRAIRDLTEYNQDVLQGNYYLTNINPWQLIYVFDGNPDTKVVCEGFAKAFQYLCDETTFSNKHVVSYIVSGKMSSSVTEAGGDHMWNLVHAGSLGNYLVDVTNAPADTVRFLSGYSSAQNGTYSFQYPDFTGDDGKKYRGGTTYYTYDPQTKASYTAEALTIASGYGPLTETDFASAKDEHTGKTSIKEATCTEPGEKKVLCTWCGEAETEIIPPKDHSWNEGEITKEPSCSDGEKTFTCSNCNESRTEVIPATGEHLWDQGVITKQPSCSDGEKTFTCSGCNESRTEVIPATGEHLWDQGVITKQPSCSDGEKTFTCSNCNESRTEAIPATGEHLWDKGVITKEPSCMEGEKTFTCTACGSTRTETLAASGKHVYPSDPVTEEPDCETPGKRIKTCSVCGHSEEEVIPAYGHKYKATFQWSEDSRFCDVFLNCERERCPQPVQTMPAVVTARITKVSTCVQAGSRIYTATLGFQTQTYTDTRETALDKDPGNHTGGTEIKNAVNATATKDGYTGDTYCKGCGEKTASGTVIPAGGSGGSSGGNGSSSGGSGGSSGGNGSSSGGSGGSSGGNGSSSGGGSGSSGGNGSSSGTTTPPDTQHPVTPPVPDTVTDIRANADGSITTTETVKDNTGKIIQITETTALQTDPSTQKVTELLTTDAGTQKKEITTVVKNNGSVLQTEILTTTDNKVITTKTTTNPDGSAEKIVSETITNSSGNTVIVTTTTSRTDISGVPAVVKQSVIKNPEPGTSVTVRTTYDTAGNEQISASVEKTVADGTSVYVTGSIIRQIVEAAGQNDFMVTFSVKDTAGNQKYSLGVNAADLYAGNHLHIYRNKAGSGKYVMVTATTYLVSSEGDFAVSAPGSGTYQLVPAEEAAAISHSIQKTIRAARSSISVRKGAVKKFKLNGKLDMDNVSKITYSTSRKAVATVSRNGKIIAKKAGTATIKAKVTLKNGTKKTVSMKIKVKK